MNLKNKLKGPWAKKKIIVLLALILVIPLAVYGVNAGVRIYRLYNTIHEPLETGEENGSEDREFEEPEEIPKDSPEDSIPDPQEEEADEDMLEENLPDEEDAEENKTDEAESEEEALEDSSTEEMEPVESFPGDKNEKDEPDLVPITGSSIWDYQEIDRPFYESTTSSENPDHLNILLLGLDEAINEPGRSDSIMVVRFNTETEEAAILSIPRDTYIHIPGHGYNKAGHANAYGGTSLAKKTVENFLDISIDHYIRIDMRGFKHSVDALGGVTIDVPERMVQEDGTVLFEAGTRHMNGEDALAYSRARKLKEGSGGDLGRIQRQQQVLFEMLRKIRSELSMNQTLSFMEDIAPYLRTDVGPGLIMSHWSAFNRLDFQDMDLRTLPGSGFIHEDIYYFRVPVENARIMMGGMAD